MSTATFIVDVDPQSNVALSLLREAAVEVRLLYEDGPAGPPWPRNAPLGARDVYVAAFAGETAVACGSLRELDRDTAEVCRMYVVRSHRRQGLARSILAHLRVAAGRLGYERLHVETGNRQAAAIRLYEAEGFTRIAPFGNHANDPTSVCYELQLEEGGGARPPPES